MLSPMPGESPGVTWPFGRSQVCWGLETSGLQTLNSAGVTKATQLLPPFLYASPASVEKPSPTCMRAWGGPRGGGPRLVRLVPACPISPCPQHLQLIHGSLSLLSGPASQAPAHIPTGRTFLPGQAFVSGSKLATGSGAQGRGGGATGPERHCKGPPHLMPHDPHLERDTEVERNLRDHPSPIHSLDEQAEAQRRNGTCPRSHSKLEAEAVLEPQLSHSRPRPLLCHAP